MIMQDRRVAAEQASRRSSTTSAIRPTWQSTSEPSTPYAAHSVAVASPRQRARTERTRSAASRNQLARLAKLLANQRQCRSGAGSARRVEQRPEDDVARKKRHQQKARHDAGEKDADDRYVGGHRVDDHDDRRRNQDTERAGAWRATRARPARRSHVASARAARPCAIVAQVAAEEPETEPKIAAAENVDVQSTVPECRCSHGASPSNICSDSRVRNRISPIQMNSGSAASSHDALRSPQRRKQTATWRRVVKSRQAQPSRRYRATCRSTLRHTTGCRECTSRIVPIAMTPIAAP